MFSFFILTVQNITDTSKEAGIVRWHNLSHQNARNINKSLLVNNVRSAEILAFLLDSTCDLQQIKQTSVITEEIKLHLLSQMVKTFE